MSKQLSTYERLELFGQRVIELNERRLVRAGMNSHLTISWDAASSLLRYQAIEPDEEDLRSFLLVFRQFVSDKEPVFISRVFNDCLRFLGSDQLKEQLKKAQDEWKHFYKVGAFGLVINNRNLAGEYVLDLWINGYYFHNDSDKAAELRKYIATSDIPLIRTQFLSVLTSLTQIILYVGSVVNYCLRVGLFHIPESTA
jgi:hypothetical protein